MSSTSASSGLTARFENADSLHPVLSIDVGATSLPSSSSCAAYMLVHLPEGLFFDPYTVGKQMYESTLLADRIELEKAVGWSLIFPELSSSVFSSEVIDSSRQWWELKAEDDDGPSTSPLQQLDARMQMQVGVQLEQALRNAIAQLNPSEDLITKQDAHESGATFGRRSILQGVLEPGSGTGRAERTSLLLKVNTTLASPRINIPLHSRYPAPTTSIPPSSTSDPHSSVGIVASTAQLVSELLPTFLSRLVSLQMAADDKSMTQVTIDTLPAYFTDCPLRSASPVGLNTLFPPTHVHLSSHLPHPLSADTLVWPLSLSSSTEPLSLPAFQVPTANFDLREAVQIYTAAAVLFALLFLVRSLHVNIARLKQFERTSL